MAGGVSKIRVVGVAIRPKTRQNFVDVDAITSKTETVKSAVIGIVERFVESELTRRAKCAIVRSFH